MLKTLKKVWEVTQYGFVVVGTYTKRVINEFALEQGLIIWLFNVTHK